MKKISMSLIVMFALMIASLSSLAAAVQSLNLKAQIPFEFSMSGKIMPAGEYQLNNTSTHNYLVIRNYDKRAAVGALVSTMLESKAVIEKSRLEFRRYGSQYFLSKIKVEGSTQVIEFTPGSQERKLANELKNLAGLSAQPEIVSVEASIVQ